MKLLLPPAIGNAPRERQNLAWSLLSGRPLRNHADDSQSARESCRYRVLLCQRGQRAQILKRALCDTQNEATQTGAWQRAYHCERAIERDGPERRARQNDQCLVGHHPVPQRTIVSTLHDCSGSESRCTSHRTRRMHFSKPP